MKQIKTGQRIEWCEEHESAAPVDGLPCERAVGTAQLIGQTADLEFCSIVSKWLSNYTEDET